MFNVWMSHGTSINESWHTQVAMTVTLAADEAWRTAIHCNTLQLTVAHYNTLQRAATHLWHDAIIPVTRLHRHSHSQITNALMISFGWLINHWNTAYLVQMCDMTHSDVCHDSFRCVSWFIQMCVMTHSCTWLCPFESVMIQVTRLIVWHTATYCNTLRHTATHCNILWYTKEYCKHTAAASRHCNTQQRTATCCTTLHHTTTQCELLLG